MDERRVAVILSVATDDVITFWFGETVDAAGSGIVVSRGSSPFVMTREVYGDKIMQTIHSFAAALVAGSVVEIVDQ